MKPDTRPTVISIVIGAIATFAIGSTVVGGAVYALSDPPQPTAAVSTERSVQLDARIDDPDDVLSPEDEARILRDAERIDAPEVVTQLNYQVFATNHENVNDTVEEYARDHRPELISDDDEHFADGVLIVGVGLDPRQSFVFAGEDVADALLLHSDSDHLDDAVTAIQPGVRDGNIPAGLFAGATTAVDEELIYDQKVTNYYGAMIAAGFVGGSLGASVVIVSGLIRRRQRQTALQARNDYEAVTVNYANLAGRLDSIDIRAHSLASPFADESLRQQWQEVRNRFLHLHETVEQLGELNRGSTDKQFRAHARTLREAATAVESVDVAEDNINTIFEIEQGNTTVRRREVHALRDDILQAQLEVDSSTDPLYLRFDELATRADALDCTAADFIDSFLVLLGDYQQALAHLKEKKFSDVKETNELEIPCIDSRDYHLGYGYHGFVPYWSLSAWHSSNVQAADNTSATNSSFSSGFSGSGGSSSF